MKYLKSYKIFELHQDTIDSYKKKRIMKFLEENDIDSTFLTDAFTGEINLDKILIQAVWKGDKKLVEFLLNIGFDVNQIIENGQTPLFSTIMDNYHEIAKLLIDRGADVNVVNSSGDTPLYRAAYEGSDELVELFLKHGADPNIYPRNSYSPLRWADVYGYKNIYKMLKDAGAR
jgi:ankyrin repeat protein